MLIRKGLEKDAGSCFRIAKLDKATHWKIEDFKTSARSRDAGFFVATENKKVVGYILGFIVPTKNSEALIHETRVNRIFRERGTGTKLVGHFCMYMAGKKIKTISALIDPKHRTFYIGSCKFKEVGKWIEVKKRVR